MNIIIMAVGWNSLLMQLSGPDCTQIAPGRAESDYGQQGSIDTFGAETDLFNFQCTIPSFLSFATVPTVPTVPTISDTSCKSNIPINAPVCTGNVELIVINNDHTLS